MSVISQAGLVLPAGGALDQPNIGWFTTLNVGSQVIAQFESTSGPGANVANPSTYLRWISTSGANQTLHLTVPSGAYNYIGIAGHNLADTGMGIGIGRDVGNTSIIAPAALAPGNNSPILFRFNSVTTTDFWINLTASGSPPGIIFPQIAVIYVGSLVYLARRIYANHVPITQGRTWRATNGMSESGQFLGRIVLQQFLKTKIPLSLFDPAYYRAVMDPFLDQAQDAPFFFAWRPNLYPDEVGYVWLTAEPAPVPTPPSNLISVTLEVTGI